jgi:radical SAM superfamily enzyme YgiQ (UPF0313 family)
LNYPDRMLLQVTKPARYTGGEWNTKHPDWGKASLRFALSYPDLYEIGMSNLAINVLYELINGQPGVICERVFAPWTDMARVLRQEHLPLISLESGHPLADFSVLGFSIGYELTFTNILNILDLAGIPAWSRDRDDNHPLVIAGGSAIFNPEPMADFIDLFVLGETEDMLPGFIKLLKEYTSASGRIARKEFLRQAARLPGIYIPGF